MSDFLATMAAGSRARAEVLDGGALRRVAADARPAPPLVWGPFGLVAEIKLVSPAEGALAAPADRGAAVAARAAAYAAAGASAVSVLTEPSRFGGHLDDLRAAAAACAVPVMRKDFLVHPDQVWEARAAGAGGVLLITRMLDDDAMDRLFGAVADAGLWTLVEAFSAEDLDRTGAALARAPHLAGRVAVGVNTRDLATLQVDPDRLERLADRFPPGVVRVAESGLHGADDIRRVRGWGYTAALVGTALMRAEDPGALAADLLRAGRS